MMLARYLKDSFPSMCMPGMNTSRTRMMLARYLKDSPASACMPGMNPTALPDATETATQRRTIRQSSHSESTEPETFQRAGQEANIAGLYLVASVDRARIFWSERTSGARCLGDVMRSDRAWRGCA